MALSRLTQWVANQILTRNALVAEFDNIYNNALSLISPLTGNLNCNLKQLTSMLFETQSSSQTAATEGRVYYQTTEDQIHVDDGTNIRRVPTIASVARGDIIRASAASQWARLAIGSSGTILRSDGTDIGYSTATYPNAATSGGVLYASAANAWATSGALTANGVVLGGGAGGAPTSTSAGTDNQVLFGVTSAAPAFASLQAGKVTRTSADVTTNSTSLVDLTGASITFTTGARRVLLTFTCTVESDQAIGAGATRFNFDIDAGTLAFGTTGQIVTSKGNGITDTVTLTFLTNALTAASHTFKVQWSVSAGTSTLRGNAANSYSFAAVELPL